ncbi:integrin alpha-M-like [Hypanus sabinus]|uniref:integrin alpha-M-like n=1 Tax=Hypanus sabinus TaxID=79690 RepID=UPI0028C4F328|nr:integrin alpha-M-like [Hypanus sabinus]
MLLPVMVCFCVAPLPLVGFNVETEQPVTFSVDDPSQFGYSLTLFRGNSNNWILVGAPHSEDVKKVQTGAVYKCRYGDRRCQKLDLDAPKGTNNLGLSMTAGDNSGLVCAPRFTYECYTNTYINGFCYTVDRTLTSFSRIPRELPECPRVLIDMAFLIDGSGSVKNHDFWRMKEFVKAIMQKFKNQDTQIAVVQFSSYVRTEFNFNEYSNTPDKERLMNQIHQQHGGTNTPVGIKYVADEIFAPVSGARDSAKRILITITDGESQNRYFNPAINAADRKNIIRYAIGVGGAFNNDRAKQEIETIASRKENVFQVTDFQALDSIRNQLQEKIFAIEGTNRKGVSSFQLEMAQEGLSSLVTSNAFVLGAAGAYDWSGGLFQIRLDNKVFINETQDQEDMKNSYLGYSMREAKSSSGTFYVVGAPRYRHRGLVLVYRQEWRGSRHVERIVSEQIGSYFGAELCLVDLMGEGLTDLVLVGAPLHRGQDTGGMVLVYKFLEGKLDPQIRLTGSRGEPLSRFGAAIAQLGDLNGDQLSDVGVGAPLEDEKSGGIYIYHGTNTGLNPVPAQHIRASAVHTGLQYFGRAIHGALDLSNDGLADIAVGALNKVFVFRSRPVVEVQVQIIFTPAKIKLKDVDCPDNAPAKPIVQVKMCFTLKELTKKLSKKPVFNLFTKMVLDPSRRVRRAEITKLPNQNFTLSQKECLPSMIEIQLENCIQDNFNPIVLEVAYKAEGLRLDSPPIPAAILSTGNTGTWIGKLPFEKECGTDNICTDKLKVDFTLSGTQYLVVGSHITLTLDVTLKNTEEDSYFTMVTFLIPLGISFRKAMIIQSSRRSTVKCDDAKEEPTSRFRSVPCQVSHPIFRTNSMMKFNATFDVNAKATWEDTVTISANATSDNENRITTESFKTMRVGVKYEVNVIIKGIQSTQYINFTTSRADSKAVSHAYRVENIDQRSLPVNISLLIPVRIRDGLSWENVQVNTPSHGAKICHQLVWTPDRTQRTGQKCNNTVCDLFLCTIQLLRYKERPVFNITGNITWKNPAKVKPQEIGMVSFAVVSYDESKYIHVSQATTRFKTASVTTRVEILKEVNPVPLIVGSSVGGLVLLLVVAGILYKVGFFRRDLKEKLEAATEDEAGSGDPQG